MNSFKFSIPVKFPIRLESIIVDAEITVSLESADGVSSQPSVFPTEMSVRTSSRVLSSVDSASDAASDVTSSDAFSVTLSVEASSETLSTDVFSVSLYHCQILTRSRFLYLLVLSSVLMLPE